MTKLNETFAGEVDTNWGDLDGGVAILDEEQESEDLLEEGWSGSEEPEEDFYKIDQFPLFTEDEERRHFECIKGLKREIIEALGGNPKKFKVSFALLGDIQRNQKGKYDEALVQKAAELHALYEEACLRNLGLACFWANKFEPMATDISILEFKDLVQLGNEAIMNAIALFDVERDNKFSTYASTAIRMKLVRAINTNKTDQSNGRDHEGKQAAIQKKILEVMGEADTILTYDEIAKALSVKVLYLIECMRAMGVKTLYLDTPDRDGKTTFLSAIIDPSQLSAAEIAEMRDLKDPLLDYFEYLTPLERNVIIYRYGLDGTKPKTLKETGQLMDPPLSKTKVGEIHKKAFSKLQEAAGVRPLGPELS